MEISLPYNFTPRDYQIKHALEPFDQGKKRLVQVWHRRAGKDKTSLNIMAREMFRRRGVYYYVLPTYSQGRKIVWEGIDAQGFKFLDHIPPQLRKRTNNQDMIIETVNGSVFRVVGSDNIDSVVGTNPVGMIFSEYSLHDPRAWDLFRPVLRENGGWATFPYTPRGRNHGYRLYKAAEKWAQEEGSEWYGSLLAITDTGVMSEHDIELERMSGMDDDLIQQEFYCSFAVGARGAYYAKELELARSTGRVGRVPFDHQIPVFTFWDLGRRDSTAIWFAQFSGAAILLPLYFESHTHGLDFYVNFLAEVQEKYKIKYAEHWLPHDGGHKNFLVEKTAKEMMAAMLQENRITGTVMVAKKLGREDGIQAVRRLLPRCYFDAERAARGVDCLENYTKIWDEKLKVFRNEPRHDWASHGADAFRTMATSGIEELYWGAEMGDHIADVDEEWEPNHSQYTESDFDPLEV